MSNKTIFSRELMKELSGIYISTDDGEYANLKLILDNVFGKDNFVPDIIWNSRKSISNDALISIATNHTTFYAKNKNVLANNKETYRLPLEKDEFLNSDNELRGTWKLYTIDATIHIEYLYLRYCT